MCGLGSHGLTEAKPGKGELENKEKGREEAMRTEEWILEDQGKWFCRRAQLSMSSVHRFQPWLA